MAAASTQTQTQPEAPQPEAQPRARVRARIRVPELDVVRLREIAARLRELPRDGSGLVLLRVEAAVLRADLTAAVEALRGPLRVAEPLERGATSSQTRSRASTARKGVGSSRRAARRRSRR